MTVVLGFARALITWWERLLINEGVDMGSGRIPFIAGIVVIVGLLLIGLFILVRLLRMIRLRTVALLVASAAVIASLVGAVLLALQFARQLRTPGGLSIPADAHGWILLGLAIAVGALAGEFYVRLRH